MAMDNKLGLPKIVAELISGENVDFDGEFSWKVVCKNNFTQLTLTWDKACDINSQYVPVPHDQVNNKYNGHGYNNRYNIMNSGQYRRKTPSEIRRNQRRKMEFLQNRLANDNKGGDNMPIVSKSKHGAENPSRDLVSNVSAVSKCHKKTSHVGKFDKAVPANSVKIPSVQTRSMAKNEDSFCQIEGPRAQSSNEYMVTSSPVTVNNDTVMSSFVSDNEPLVSEGEYDHDETNNIETKDSSDSEDDMESDPVLAPGCFNTECSYGGGPGSRVTGIKIYQCAKCKTEVCSECYEEGTAHSGHRKYLKLQICNK